MWTAVKEKDQAVALHDETQRATLDAAAEKVAALIAKEEALAAMENADAEREAVDAAKEASGATLVAMIAERDASVIDAALAERESVGKKVDEPSAPSVGCWAGDRAEED